MAEEVRIDATRFLRRLQRLNTQMLADPALFGSCLQLAHGKRGEETGEKPFVVSLQVRAPPPPLRPPLHRPPAWPPSHSCLPLLPYFFHPLPPPFTLLPPPAQPAGL